MVVATPGRLNDLINRGDARLDQVAITVLDEADQMADMGFLPQVTKLLEQVAPRAGSGCSSPPPWTVAWTGWSAAS